MKHPTPARLRALAGPARASPAATLALAITAAIGALAALPGAADAACVCRCVDGKPKAVCSSGTDIPPLCTSMTCPLSPPRVSPLDALQPKPAVKPGCTTRQVYNPDTGRHEWGQICQ